MNPEVAQHWNQAQACEAARDWQGAIAAYQAMLALDAGQVAAWLKLSALEQGMDRYRAASQHALNASKAVAERRDWKNLPFVTMRLLSFDERDAVRDLIVGADWSHRDVIGQSAVLSQHLWLVNEYDAALRLIDEAQRYVPAHHLLSYSRANALRYCGRMDEATAEYERCIGLKPDYAYAHWSLAYHQKSDPPGSRIDRLKRAKAAHREGSIDRVHICYALFKELDDLGEPALAWPELEEGAQAMRRMLRYDPIEEQRRLAALQELATPGFFADAGVSADDRVPVFIVGMPRTGTTLVERILSNHEQIASAGELNDFGQSASWVSDHFFSSPLRERSLARWAAADYPAIGREYLRRTERIAGAHGYLIDKNPVNFFNAGFIRKALPQAKIVCLVREPMDACFSNLKELFTGEAYGYSYDLQELADHYIAFDRLRSHWEDTMPEHLHTVRYEDLVADPAGVTRGIMAFCGVPYAADSIDITRNAAPVSTASSSQVRQPIHAGNVDAWEKYAAYLKPLKDRLAAGRML